MSILLNTTEIFDPREVDSRQFFKRFLAKRHAWSKDCRVNDKVAAAKQALAAGLHSHCSRSVSPKHFENDDCEDHPEDEDDDFDFDYVEKDESGVYPDANKAATCKAVTNKAATRKEEKKVYYSMDDAYY